MPFSINKLSLFVIDGSQLIKSLEVLSTHVGHMNNFVRVCQEFFWKNHLEEILVCKVKNILHACDPIKKPL